MADPMDQLLYTIGGVLKKKRMRPSELFRGIDTDGNGEFSYDELKQALGSIDIKLGEAELGQLLARLDRDGSGEVSYREFEKEMKKADKAYSAYLATQKEAKKPSKSRTFNEDKEEFRQIFCLFKQLCRSRASGSDEPELVDWDESGNVSTEELEQLLETVGLKLSPAELEAMVRDIDTDGNGNIDFEEFCKSMSQNIQVDYTQDQIVKAFEAFQKNAPEGMIRVKDLREALKTYLHKDMIDAQVDELVLHYEDCFVRLPGSDVEYFHFQDYVDLMAPIGGFTDP
jgi:calmodulin